MFDTTMPAISLDQFQGEERQLVELITTTRNADHVRRLRASKPTVKRNVPITNEHGHTFNYPDEITGKAAYLWRMVAFAISPIGQHHCMPVTCEFDLPHRQDWNERRELAKELDALADRIIDTVPANKRHDINRWGRALGYF